MNHLPAIALGFTLLAGTAVPALAAPGGCLKYGAGGAVAGHVAGHHAVLGALAGCATGMVVRHRDRAADQQRDEDRRQMPSHYGRTGDPRYDGQPNDGDR